MTERWLLDQNFPKPVFEDIAELDRSTRFEHFSDIAPDLAAVSTPDFMVYLVGEAQGFTGVVTRDLSQLEDDDSLVTLAHLTLSVVTWKRGVDDALVLWGQLLAYMPQVRRLLGQSGPGIVVLPAPRLGPQHLFKASSIGRGRQAVDKVSWPERQQRSLDAIRTELHDRGRDDLTNLLAR